MQIYMNIFCYFNENTTFAPTYLKDIHNKCKHSEWHASVALFLIY